MAGGSQWYYAEGGEQKGPTSTEELRNLLAGGQISVNTLVWREGMPSWIPASQILGVGGASAPATTPDAVAGGANGPAAPVAMGYYTSTMDMPPRAIQNLKGHALPVGDTGDWPLNDSHINTFEVTAKLRKKVTAAASVYKLLLLLTGIGLAVLVPTTLFALAATGNRGALNVAGLSVTLGVVLGLGILYYFAYRGTRKSQRWAPIAMTIIFSLSALLQIASLIMTSTQSMSAAAAGAAFVPLIFVLLFAGAFIWVSWRAATAIPQYLAQPAWCQELIVKAGL